MKRANPPSIWKSAAASLLGHALAGAIAFALTSAAYLRLGKSPAGESAAARVGTIQEIDVRWHDRLPPAKPRAHAPHADADAAIAGHPGASSVAIAGGPARAASKPAGDAAPALAPASADSAAPAGAGSPSDLALIRDAIATRLRYPVSLRARRIEGRVEVALTISAAEGRLESARVSRSSGNAELDALALEAARGAAPFAGLSPETKKKGRLELSLPFEFTIR